MPLKINIVVLVIILANITAYFSGDVVGELIKFSIVGLLAYWLFRNVRV